MASSASMSAGGVSVPRQYAEESEVTGWVGWIVFAGTMMALLGMFHMFEGLIALFRHTEIAFPASGMTIQVSYTQWGWLQLIAGALVLAAGVALFTGRMWARTLGVILVSISALVNFAWANLYPFWSLTLGDRLLRHLRDHRARQRDERGRKDLSESHRWGENNSLGGSRSVAVSGPAPSASSASSALPGGPTPVDEGPDPARLGGRCHETPNPNPNPNQDQDGSSPVHRSSAQVL